MAVIINCDSCGRPIKHGENNRNLVEVEIKRNGITGLERRVIARIELDWETAIGKGLAVDDKAPDTCKQCIGDAVFEKLKSQVAY